MENENYSRSASIKIRGIVSSGIGESRLFTGLPWVQKQFIEKLDINPFPGTLNVIIFGQDREKFGRLKHVTGIEIVPENVHYCSGKAFRAFINGRVSGAVVIPLVPGYPEDKLEIISSEHLKHRLELKDGDEVEITIFL